MRDWPTYLLIALVVIAGASTVAVGVKMYKQRGLRNNNPGNLVITNIKWNGKIPVEKNTDGKFEQFVDAFSGIRAMFSDLRGDIEKDKLNTIRKLITSYAPPHENLTEKYIASVSSQINLAENKLITPSHYLPLMKAIIKHENGIQPYSDAEIVRAMGAV